MQKTDHGHPIDPDRVCESLTKRGRPCQNPLAVGQRLCSYHGGQVAERLPERARILSSPEAPKYALDPDVIKERRKGQG